MSRCCRKLILFLVSLLVVWNLVDFSTQPFDPLREQIQLSTQHITSSSYYQGYVVPLQTKCSPTVYKFQDDYIVPTFQKASSFVTDKYQVLLSSHVNQLSDKVISSHVYQSYGVKLVDYSDKFVGLFKQYSQLAFEKTAVGITKSTLTSKIFYVQAANKSTVILKKLEVFKQSAQTHYKKSAIPALHKAKNFIIKYSILGCEKTVDFTFASCNATKAFFSNRVCPFYCKQIKPKIQNLYAKYLQKHYETYLQPHVTKVQPFFTLVKVKAVKCYDLMRVQEILRLSQSLLKSSYKELDEQFSVIQDEETPIHIVDKPLRTFVSNPDLVDETTTESKDTILAESKETTIAEETTKEEKSSEDREIDVKSEDSENEVVLSLGDEISNWEEFITETIGNIFKNFERSISDLEIGLLNEIKPQITKRLQSFSNKLQVDYSDVNKIIYNIDSHPAVLENGEPVELDKDGKIIDHKISRQEFRDLLAANKDFATTESEAVQEFLTSKIKELENDIDSERKLIVDIYEEFAEVAITEFSKKMMYSTYSNSFNKISNMETLDNNSENFNDWKQYIKVKNSLIEQRENLIAKQTDLADLNKYIFEIQTTLKTFIHEAGSYYSILRAKANIEFQEREAREAASESSGYDETVTVKSTVIKVVTQTIEEEADATETVHAQTQPQEEVTETVEVETVEEVTETVEVEAQEAATETVEVQIENPQETVTVSLTETVQEEEETQIVDVPQRTTVRLEEVEKTLEDIQEIIEEIKEELTDKIEEEQAEEPSSYENINVHEQDEKVIKEEDDIVQHKADQPSI